MRWYLIYIYIYVTTDTGMIYHQKYQFNWRKMMILWGLFTNKWQLGVSENEVCPHPQKKDGKGCTMKIWWLLKPKWGVQFLGHPSKNDLKPKKKTVSKTLKCHWTMHDKTLGFEAPSWDTKRIKAMAVKTLVSHVMMNRGIGCCRSLPDLLQFYDCIECQPQNQ